MNTTNIKEVVIERLAELPKEEVAKVLIFMAGLDAGMRICNNESVKQVEASIIFKKKNKSFAILQE